MEDRNKYMNYILNADYKELFQFKNLIILYQKELGYLKILSAKSVTKTLQNIELE